MHKWKRTERNSGTGGGPGKAVVMGLVDRHTKEIRVMRVPDTERDTLQRQIHEYLGSDVHTDACIAYTGLDAEYVHNVIDHIEAYAIGQSPHKSD